jgi:hypothetical protein
MKAPFGCTLADSALVVNHHGEYMPCCRFQAGDQLLPKEKEIDAHSVMRGQLFSAIRQSLNQGRFPKGCEVCQSDEQHGMHSLRMKRQGVFKASPGQLVDLELFVGSLCNMKCRMCNHNYSSLWAKEEGRLPAKDYDPLVVLARCDLNKLRHLRLLGGETLINKDFFRILEYVKKYAAPQEITLSFSTNGSRAIDDHLVKHLALFKRVEVDFSVDALGSLAEYIRPGVSWETIASNIQSWMSCKNEHGLNWNLNVHTTIQALNTHAIFDIIEFCSNHKLTWSHRILTEPDELSWLRTPQHVRKHICAINSRRSRHTHIKDYMTQYSSASLFEILTSAFEDMDLKSEKDLIDYLEQWDHRWNVRWQVALPQFWQEAIQRLKQ